MKKAIKEFKEEWKDTYLTIKQVAKDRYKICFAEKWSEEISPVHILYQRNYRGGRNYGK